MALLAHLGLSLWPYLVCATLTGLGGGNFTASMTNANAFYPHRFKCEVLVFAGRVDNLGVPMIQVVEMLGHRQRRCLKVLRCVQTLCGAVDSCRDQSDVVHEQHRAPPCRGNSRPVDPVRGGFYLRQLGARAVLLLYLASFGSFIGFSFAFSQVLETNFVASRQSTPQVALHIVELVFIGPTLATVARCLG